MGWVSKFDTNFWEAGLYATWTGSAWDDTGPGWFFLWVKTGTTWAQGYRPTKVRFYGTPLSDTDNLRNGNNWSIAVGDHEAGAYLELECTFADGTEPSDIHSLVCSGTVPLTDIQFYEPGWPHKFLGVANASISKIVGIAKASIAKVIES